MHKAETDGFRPKSVISPVQFHSFFRPIHLDHSDMEFILPYIFIYDSHMRLEPITTQFRLKSRVPLQSKISSPLETSSNGDETIEI